MTIRLLLSSLFLLAATTARGDDDLDFFEQRIRPILVEKCQSCHGPEKQKGGLRLDSKEAWRRGGGRGPAVVPKDVEQSPLIAAVRRDDDLAMPPSETAKLNDREVADLVEWVRRGAPDPREGVAQIGGMTRDEASRLWSLRPVARPVVPARQSLTGNAIDAFLDARIGSSGMAVAPRADRRTLIRRVTFDLTGLPPPLDEVKIFEADESPGAFAKVVDRLLASPHYGERWGRRWLDVVRYADTAGENSDRPLPHAWKYRNWVIAAFNADLPYDEFVRLQIAGDLMTAGRSPGETADRIVATGFLAIARRFGHDIDKDVHLTREDAIDTTGKAFLGLTIACARCHDHKFDPITADDYYALYGILAGTRLPFPGCEPTPAPRDLVPLATGGMAFAVAEGTPGDVPMHMRGDPEKPGVKVPRRWLEVLGGQPVPPGGGSGRLALAGWLTGPENPLAARVMVNRIWLGHFGRGIVPTPSDFGSRGRPPTNPELLDWLASEFIASGWSVKAMHRLIVSSDAYRRSCEASADVDPENARVARFERRRLSAEELRDALLVAADRLDRTPGGPHPFPPESTWHFSQHDPFAATYPNDRRAVYQMTLRNRRDPFASLFDGADPNSSTPVRDESTVPTQALFFLNSPLVHECSERIAGRLGADRSEDQRIERLYEILLQRSPSMEERERGRKFVADYAGAVPDVEKPTAPWSALARVLIGGNEFLYVE
ncbi:MAG: PSD1 and planctomycete cytochrome C domain-containing protein [Paludisphaera borealis]|uniref:PSD1 and planctomycete cytochrome C domain-containing protein n=1 Tax=Paludisphaera borealis TaxID=1387353 RepID=UPI002848E876|nr:PSD1 and planctomycete cytochrome C domain-containing protein [Paludisphaera borealis]MDR3619457.1 PSD1 and planctomycete cytochrome C domain-containing protein [Paludisphaera borealis]